MNDGLLTSLALSFLFCSVPLLSCFLCLQPVCVPPVPRVCRVSSYCITSWFLHGSHPPLRPLLHSLFRLFFRLPFRQPFCPLLRPLLRPSLRPPFHPLLRPPFRPPLLDWAQHLLDWPPQGCGNHTYYVRVHKSSNDHSSKKLRERAILEQQIHLMIPRRTLRRINP